MTFTFRSCRRVGIALVATFVLPTAALSPPVTAVPAAPIPVPVLRWGSCGDDFPGFQCAVATVPLDYDRPSRGTTQLALARIRATDRAHRIGTLFLNPGGPGGSGVEFVLGVGEFLNSELDGRFDIVGFDPRGVGLSDPLHCFESEDALGEHFAGISVFPYRRGLYRPFFATFKALGRECRDDRQAVVRHMSTADVARDLDLLRRAVGDSRLSYLGFSYGSYLGTTYANLFPRRVRALVIDGVLNPRLWSSGWQIRSDRVATQQEFDEFLRLCDEAGDDCAFTGPGGSAARWEALARALRREPLELPEGQYSYDFLIGDATSVMYAPEVWGGPEGAAAFFDFLADAVLGDQAAAAEAAAIRRSLIDRLTAPSAEADYDNGLDAYFGNQCADTEYPMSFLAFRIIDVYARAGSRFGPNWWWFNSGCVRWPVNADRYIGPWNARTSAPVLVVGNFFDGVTAHTGAVATDRLLRRSRLLSYAGWGHTAYSRNECTRDYVNAYLLEGSLPPVGTVCPANPNPFSPPAVRAAAANPPLIGLPPSCCSPAEDGCRSVGGRISR